MHGAVVHEVAVHVVVCVLKPEFRARVPCQSPLNV